MLSMKHLDLTVMETTKPIQYIYRLISIDSILVFIFRNFFFFVFGLKLLFLGFVRILAFGNYTKTHKRIQIQAKLIQTYTIKIKHRQNGEKNILVFICDFP